MSDPTPIDQAEHDRLASLAFLTPDASEVGKLTLRPFSAATMAMMRQTRNEWLKRVPLDEMENADFATLAWLYIQGAPENEVRRTIWNETLFRESVLKWASEPNEKGEPRISSEDLAETKVQIAFALDLIHAAQVEVKEKPDDPSAPPSSAPEPPPNS